MASRFSEYPAPPTNTALNSFGYTQRVPHGSWLVSDEHGYPVRVHDGFAVFTDQKQAAWCAEMARNAFEQGRDAMRAELRGLLGIAEPDDD